MIRLVRDADLGRTGRAVKRAMDGGRWWERLPAGMTFSLGVLALALGMLADSLGAQATGGASRDPHYRGIVCENFGRTASAEYTDSQGLVHQLWYENFGFRTGNPSDPGGWFEMGKSGPGSELPADHRVSGGFEDNRHTLNGNDHSGQDDLDHAHAFNMVQGLLNICLNTEG